jgi:two-component system response regulator HydG
VVEADGGTLFLDEIGDMPLALQAKLLRVLQSGEVRAVGSEAVRTVDVRCIAATHRDLKSLVQAGQFREDLFFRLDVLRVRVPPLRERREDIPALVEHFLERCARRIPQGTMAGFTPEAFDLLCKYAWPGNVRELENLIERLAVTTAARHVGVAEIREAVGWVRPGDPVSNLLREPMTLAELEDRYIEAVLEKADGNKARAAGLLGIDLSTLYRRQRRRAG